MKFFLSIICFLGIVNSVSSQTTSSKPAVRPNIIWLMAEDMSLDLECYGMKGVKTPNLNRLAESGVLYDNAFCTNPICSPSRSAMMVGAHQLCTNSHHHRSNRELPLEAPYQPFTHLLRKAGYTCILGSNLVMGKGRKIDVNFKHKAIGKWDGKSQFGLFDKYDEFTREDQPFFAQIQLNVTHRGDWWNKISQASQHPVHPDSVQLPPFMADNPVVRQDWARYLDMVEYMDNEVGAIIQDLKTKGILDNSIIIFIGDNGRCNIRGKGYLNDPGLHIPLIISGMGVKSQKEKCNTLVSTTDITASILELAHVELPDYLTGKPLLSNQNIERENILGARDLWDEVMEKSRCLVDKRYTYIKHYMPEVPFDAHQGYLEFYRPAVHVMRGLNKQGKLTPLQKLFFNPTKEYNEELYDRIKDPNQTINLAQNKAYKSLRDSFRIELKKVEKTRRYIGSTKPEVVDPIAPKLVDFVRQQYPSAYSEMQQGIEIGFSKYRKLYQKRYPKGKK